MTASNMSRAVEVVRAVLAPYGVEVRVSPLGPEWSSDVDAYVRSEPPHAVLLAAGWLPLDAVLTAAGSPGRGRWAVADDGTVLAKVDVEVANPPSAVDSVLRRARRRGEVREREVLELRLLAERGETIPRDHDVVRVAADIESGRAKAPVALRPQAERVARAAVARARRRSRSGAAIAITGVDGAGKSTVVDAVGCAFERAGVPFTVVWARPGMRLGFMRAQAVWVRQRLGHSPEPAVRTIGQGKQDTFTATRRGLTGWAWSTFVTAAFLVDVWRLRVRAQGFVVHDRHLADALVTLDAVYGDVDLRVQKWLLRVLMPRVAATFHLTVPVEVAVARKPDDTFGRPVIEAQLARYEDALSLVGNVAILDGARPVDGLVREIITGFASRATV